MCHFKPSFFLAQLWPLSYNIFVDCWVISKAQNILKGMSDFLAHKCSPPALAKEGLMLWPENLPPKKGLLLFSELEYKTFYIFKVKHFCLSLCQSCAEGYSSLLYSPASEQNIEFLEKYFLYKIQTLKGKMHIFSLEFSF